MIAIVTPWDRGLLAVAGSMGAAGVGIGAAGAHLGGGELAHLSSEFLLIHATVVIGLLALSSLWDRRIRYSAALLAIGATLFSGDLAFVAFAGARTVPGLAPIGGLLLIAGWGSLIVSALVVCRSSQARG